jgi:DeoR/GlpR family transcriptional regulator of sugar metabolism
MTSSSTAKAAIASAIATLITGGTLRIKDSGGNVLVTTGALTWTPSGNTVTSSDPAAVNITTSGTAATYEILSSTGTVEFSGTVGTSGAEETVGSTTFTAGVQFDQGVFTITVN